jgi:hypothetical protein
MDLKEMCEGVWTGFMQLRKDFIKGGISSPVKPLFHSQEIVSCPAVA